LADTQEELFDPNKKHDDDNFFAGHFANRGEGNCVVTAYEAAAIAVAVAVAATAAALK
jgi:hypothetical protein